MVAYHLLRLYKEDKQIALVSQQINNFRAAVNRLVQNKHAFSLEMLSNNFRKTADEHFGFLESSLIKTRVYRLVNITLADEIPEQDSLSNLLQQQEESKGNRVRYIAGILVMIGLLGTFLGLVQAIKYLQHFFTATEALDLTTLFSDMKHTLGGLDKAFGTSIGGITAYIVLGYLNVVLRTKRASVLNQIEDMTLEHFLPILRNFRGEKSRDVSTNAVEILQTIPATLSKELGSVLEDLLTRTIGGSSEDLKATGAYLQQAARGIQEGQETFTRTVTSFGEFLSSFQEGKSQLMTSQEAIASGIREFSQALLKLEENQKMLASSLDMTKGYIEGSETRLGSMDEIVRQMHTIWSENRQIFEHIAEKIELEHATLVQTTEDLKEFLSTSKEESQNYFQVAQQEFSKLTEENTGINRTILESHSLLTTLLQEMKSFILDEHNGLRLLSGSMNETFGEARLQYLRLVEHFESLYKRVHESQEQLSDLQETVDSIQQQLQSRRPA